MENDVRFDFQLSNHVPLRIFRDASIIQQSFRQMALIVPLEDILVNDESE